ncbi:hypothetical protein DEU56DRAFT_757158 [Suillus clintonianus]|uniref:uncharacterized protein n=1 Tax=Suillus clintonianus TaxID=1904413 RepID=UPI001B874DAF|nr:uncharacterized protein DEU56DRAFT_757158 [Suillus clintonianus]KAG2133340.1 hypothetical protein DEU56DRAFT_757158 [Suillus clintonianus]
MARSSFASFFAAILLVPSCQPLFETKNDILDFLGWDSGYESLPAFKELDISVADLVVGVKDHEYFKKDGTPEFVCPCARALQRHQEKPPAGIQLKSSNSEIKQRNSRNSANSTELVVFWQHFGLFCTVQNNLKCCQTWQTNRLT